MPFILSQRELKRVGDLAYSGKTFEMFLANNTGGLTRESTYSAWKAVELPAGNGYAAVTGTLSGGTYNTTEARYEFPQLAATFTASAGGAGLSWDTVCLRIGTETYLHSISEEIVTLAPGQATSYPLTLGTDD